MFSVTRVRAATSVKCGQEIARVWPTMLPVVPLTFYIARVFGKDAGFLHTARPGVECVRVCMCTRVCVGLKKIGSALLECVCGVVCL